MSILAALSREQREIEEELAGLQKKLDGIRIATKALGHSTKVESNGLKKRRPSAAGRAAISKVAKLRWAKIKAKKAA